MSLGFVVLKKVFLIVFCWCFIGFRNWCLGISMFFMCLFDMLDLRVSLEVAFDFTHR